MGRTSIRVVPLGRAPLKEKGTRIHEGMVNRKGRAGNLPLDLAPATDPHIRHTMGTYPIHYGHSLWTLTLEGEELEGGRSDLENLEEKIDAHPL